MAQQLSGIRVDEVSLVPSAAIRRRFLVLKGDGGKPEADMAFDEVAALKLLQQLDAAGQGSVLEALAKEGAPEDEDPDHPMPEGMSEEEAVKYRAARKILGKELASKVMKSAQPEPGVTELYVVPGIGRIAKRASGWDLTAVAEAARPTVEALLKARDGEAGELREKLAKAEKDTAEKVAALKKQQDEKERQEMIGVVSAFQHLPGMKPDDVAPALLVLKRASAPAYERIHGILKAADEMLHDGTVVLPDEPSGDSASGQFAGEATEQLLKQARERVTKSGGKESLTDAMSAVAKANPELYESYRAEQSR